MTKKRCQEFGEREIRILGAVSKLDGFLLKLQVRVQSGIAAETSQNYDMENQEYNEDRPQNGPHLEVGTSINRSQQNSDPDGSHSTK